jgi:hypothetical protein
LILIQQIVFAQYFLLIIVSIAHNSSEQVKDEEIAEEDKYHEKEGPVNVVLNYWLHVDAHRIYTVIHHIDPALSRGHLEHGRYSLRHVIKVRIRILPGASQI